MLIWSPQEESYWLSSEIYILAIIDIIISITITYFSPLLRRIYQLHFNLFSLAGAIMNVDYFVDGGGRTIYYYLV